MNLKTYTETLQVTHLSKGTTDSKYHILLSGDVNMEDAFVYDRKAFRCLPSLPNPRYLTSNLAS